MRPEENLPERQPLQSATEKPIGQSSAEFSQVMGRPMPQGVQPPIGGTSPMQLAGAGTQPTVPPTADMMLAQARNMNDTLGTIGNQLKTKDLKLTRSQNNIIKRNLADANGHIQQAAGKLGVDVKPLDDTLSSGTLTKFLAWIGHGQDSLVRVQDKLNDMTKNPDSISAPDMMVAQMKMNQASNEVQFASMLLGKIIETIKTILQTQL